MKSTLSLPVIIAIALLMIVITVLLASAQYEVRGGKATLPIITQRTFPTPEDAVNGVREAAKNKDNKALHEIFGEKLDELMTGDPVEDASDIQEFAASIAQRWTPVSVGTDSIILNVGSENWPFPIPLVRHNNAWTFNTAAGKEEYINRNVGEDELNTIGVCRTFVEAQRKYYLMDRDGDGILQYATRFKSSAGKRDGLYWEPLPGEELSPFGPFIAEAQSEGYTEKPLSKSRRPFHGYFFKILKGQGAAAPGGAYSYVINGNMVAGFALVAYPAHWGESGVMTFIVNQQGKVYQRNLGEKTLEAAEAMTEYNPDEKWMVVPERATSER